VVSAATLIGDAQDPYGAMVVMAKL
jgi:hypothetical protein